MPANRLRPGGFKDDQLLDPDFPRPVRSVIYSLLVAGLLVAVTPTAVLLVAGAQAEPNGFVTWQNALFALAAIFVAMAVAGLVALVGSLVIGRGPRQANTTG